MMGLAKFARNVASRDNDRRLKALKWIADWIVPDFRLTWSQLDWWHDADFNAYLDRFGYRKGFHTHHRWTLWQLIRLVSGVDGDTAECGVWEGASSWLICAANRGKPRIHHLFDSFEGMSAPGPKDGDYWKPGAMAADEDLVRRNLQPFEGAFVIHKGWIPERFEEVTEKMFAFVHIDVDLHEPTLGSVEFFYSRLAPGGIMLCDDYAIGTCVGATKAIDDFFDDKPEKMITLDAGGGFIIKGVVTASAKDLSPVLMRQRSELGR
jgi:hypothetical protein